MFEISTVGKNGQITLPRALRQRMQIGAGDLISFEQKGDEIVMKLVRAEDAFEEIRGRGIPGIGRGRTVVKHWIRNVRGEL